MSLIELWRTDRQQVTNKRLHQLIAFAGDGSLLDSSTTSHELRELMSAVPSDLLGEWIKQVLNEGFTDSGLALQDIVNEIGSRLGFAVEHGRYRGRPGEPGHDGLWQTAQTHAIVVECKTSTAFKINLSKIASYSRQIGQARGLSGEDLSTLIVVGDEDTDDLEAQVRGSRFAWNVRLIGVDALFRLLRLRETLDDPAVAQQIRDILVPQEFTRLDRIIDLVFATTEDAQEPEQGAVQLATPDADEPDDSRPRADFHAQILPQIERKLETTLVKRSRVTWASPRGDVLVSCQVSSERPDTRGDALYWFGLKSKTADLLGAAARAHCAFGLGSPQRTVLLPFDVVREHLPGFFTSPDAAGGIMHWHIRFRRTGERIDLLVNRDREGVEVSRYLI